MRTSFWLVRVTTSQASAVPVDNLKYHQYSFYMQDSWRTNKRLTLNYGLRFDHQGQWYGAAQGNQVWNPATINAGGVDPGISWHGRDASIAPSGFNSPLFYLEPRVSFAYDLTGTGKTVVRGGVALFRYQISANEVTSNNAADGPIGAFTYTTNNTIMGGYQGISGMNQTPPSTGGAENGGTIRCPGTWRRSHTIHP